MKQKILKLCVIFLILPCLLIGGCNKPANGTTTVDPNATPTPTSKVFGEYGYNGKYLREYSVGEISLSEAKKIVAASKVKTYATQKTEQGLFISKHPNLSLVTDPNLSPSEEQLHSILDKYSVCIATTDTFVENGNASDPNHTVEIRGTDLRNMLKNNEYTPFAQMDVKIVMIFDEILDNMEATNQKFMNSSNKDNVPFRKIFTYGKDSLGNLVLKISDYSEMPSSESGGISSSYRQDFEICYDSEGKIRVWQASLGLSIATPKGTVKQGYILKCNFTWEIKD